MLIITVMSVTLFPPVSLQHLCHVKKPTVALFTMTEGAFFTVVSRGTFQAMYKLVHAILPILSLGFIKIVAITFQCYVYKQMFEASIMIITSVHTCYDLTSTSKSNEVDQETCIRPISLFHSFVLKFALKPSVLP